MKRLYEINQLTEKAYNKALDLLRQELDNETYQPIKDRYKGYKTDNRTLELYSYNTNTLFDENGNFYAFIGDENIIQKGVSFYDKSANGKMSFREQLNKANELDFSISELKIANECDCIFEFEYTEREFEDLCCLAHDCYLKAEQMTEFAIAMAINEFIVEENYTIEEVLDLYKWDLINKASTWL